MWRVLRRLQGEEYATGDAPAGIVANMNHITRHECKPNAPPLPDQLLTEPYGLHVYSKLVRKLDAEDEALRQKALLALLSLFGQKQDNVVLSIKYGAVPALMRRLTDSVEKARALGSQALMWIVQTPLGLRHVLDDGLLPDLMAAVDDESPVVAVEALRCLAAMDCAIGESEGTKALMSQGAVRVYIRKAAQGPDSVTVHALIALSKVFNVKEAFIKVLNEGAMGTLAELLRTRAESPEVVESVCDIIARLCFYGSGKRAAVELNVLSELRGLIDSPSVPVRQSVTAAVMSATVGDDGKRQALDAGVCDSLVDLFCGGEEDDVVCVNALKAVCNCSENPPARARFKRCIPRLQELSGQRGANNQLLRRSAARAVHMINWEPGKPIEPL